MILNPKIGLLVAGMLVMASTSANALVCGTMTCEVAGAANDSPYSVGDSGDFATSVDNVSDPSVGFPPENAGDSFAHAWTFTLNEAAHINGTLTNNNSLPAFSIDGLTLELFGADNPAAAIGGAFVVPTGGTNPLVQFAFMNLGAGDYFFKVTGDLLSNDGQYASQVAVSQVPLPPAIFMFLTALVGWASVARIGRRRSPQNA